ncbi:complement component C1q receptor-like [Scyliorhinus torazame]|uniref:complement component C1q receptor-like n=1 Tax=Scyliorhinus torazame TaxID=75743 RepID=UPI003B5A8C10
MLRVVFMFLWFQSDWQKSGVRSGATAPEFCNAGVCYSLHWEGDSFSRAKKLCEGRKGMLTTMESQVEAENIRQLLAKAAGARAQLIHLWIGLQRKAKRCSIQDRPLRGFSWVSGTDHSTYSPWVQEPLQTCTHERCVQLQVNFTRPARLAWTTCHCNKRSDGFICKYARCEALNTTIGKVVYEESPQSENVPSPGLSRGSVAIISCANGRSVALRCELQNGRMGWPAPGGLESLCTSCWKRTSDGPCPTGCFSFGPGLFCYCDKGFIVDHQQHKCIPGAASESGSHQSPGTPPEGTQSPAANITPLHVWTPTTNPPTTPLQPAENSTLAFSPVLRGGSGQGKPEARSNDLVYQVVIGALVLMLLVAIAVIVIRGRGKVNGAVGQAGVGAPAHTQSLLQGNEKAPGDTVSHENHYVETPSASEGDVNAPVDQGEVSEPVAH